MMALSRVLTLLRELQAGHSMSKTIMLIDSSERDIVIEAFRRGACGVISRDELFETLCECIRPCTKDKSGFVRKN